MSSCVKVQVPPEACYVRFSHGTISRSEQIGETARGEMMIVDYDADGRVLGIELVGADKPCQT
jgi:uncharacterized protein YuzE